MLAIAVNLTICISFGILQSAYSSDPATFTDGVCLDCHDDAEQSLMGSGHDVAVNKAKVSCIGCHIDADGAHLDDPDNLPINTAKLSPIETAKVCLTCHPGFHGANHLERDPHAANQVNCSGCHRVHDNTRVGLLADDEPELCLECHAAVEGDFFQPFRHPVKDGVVRCSECHLMLFQISKQNVYAGSSAPCFHCHGRFQGPFPFQHQATVDYSTEEGGCLNCHAAHGSEQPRMLKQPYDATNQALCLQCHLVPGHDYNSFHGSQWAGIPCSECHVDIHGSYTSRNFLSSSLQVQGCFNAGCHAD